MGAVNYFNEQSNQIKNLLTAEYGKVTEVARYYKKQGIGTIVVGDENYGEGSSREHAAMEPRFLNVKVVIVKSFARIHETNLKKQGMLALTFDNKDDYDKILEDDRIDLLGFDRFEPGSSFTLVLNHKDGSRDEIKALHSYSKVQIDWFRAGSALNLISKENK